MTDAPEQAGGRVLITGGSGFIGTNLVAHYRQCGRTVLNVDARAPRDGDQADVFTEVDIRCRASLLGVFAEFRPRDVVHLAARTDLAEKRDIGAYAANTIGTENVVAAVAQTPQTRRCVFASTKLVCPNGVYPRSQTQYDPQTLYGRSKVIGEQIVRRDSSMKAAWCIVRPGSIWGPWFGAPYRNFFLAIGRGRYVHPGAADVPKHFGYVGNVVYQIDCLLRAPREQVHRRVFYLSDYETITLRRWADLVARELGARSVRSVPRLVARVAALAGDALHAVGCAGVPLTSFRLANMLTDTSGTPLADLAEITGPLPYSLEQGVKQTVQWLRQMGMIR